MSGEVNFNHSTVFDGTVSELHFATSHTCMWQLDSVAGQEASFAGGGNARNPWEESDLKNRFNNMVSFVRRKTAQEVVV